MPRLQIVIAFLLLSLLPASARAAHLYIWSGATDAKLAQDQLSAFGAFAKPIAPYVDLAARVVESAKVNGLKPGFFVVAFGLCDQPLNESLLFALEGINPKLYARRVDAKADHPELAGLRCPEFRIPTAEATKTKRARWDSTFRYSGKSKGVSLLGVGFNYEMVDREDDLVPSRGQAAAVFFAVAADGRVLDTATLEVTGVDRSQFHDYDLNDSSVFTGMIYFVDIACDGHMAWEKVEAVNFKVRLKGDKLAVEKSKRTLRQENGCDGDE
jgi:hypothetical protein